MTAVHGGPPTARRSSYRAWHPTDPELAHLSRPAQAAYGPPESDGVLGHERRRQRSAPDHAAWRRQLRSVMDPRRQADHLLVELQESAQSQLRPVHRQPRRHGPRAAITTNADFDGFPMFSPDGKKLVWASEPVRREGGRDQLFIADWRLRTERKIAGKRRETSARGLRLSFPACILNQVSAISSLHLRLSSPHDRPHHCRVLIVALFVSSVKIIGQAEVMVIERLGRFRSRRSLGTQSSDPLHRAPAHRSTSATSRPMSAAYETDHAGATARIDLREQVLNFPSQPVITKDNVTIDIDAVLYYRIADPQKATYAVQNLPYALETLTRTTLRNIVGEMELDHTLASRDIINKRMREVIEEASIGWGVDVTRVELQSIEPPRDIQQSMELQMRAERERRAAVTNAEAGKRAAILEAEGQRESQVRKAEGEKRRRHPARARPGRGAAGDGAGRSRSDRPHHRRASRRPGRDVPARPQVPRGAAAAHAGKGTTIFLPAEASGVMGALGGLRELLSATGASRQDDAARREHREPGPPLRPGWATPACRRRLAAPIRAAAERLSSTDGTYQGTSRTHRPRTRLRKLSRVHLAEDQHTRSVERAARRSSAKSGMPRSCAASAACSRRWESTTTATWFTSAKSRSNSLHGQKSVEAVLLVLSLRLRRPPSPELRR